MAAEQQRAAAIRNELQRQKDIQRLQQQSQKNPTGNTNIRKLIKSAATRDWTHIDVMRQITNAGEILTEVEQYPYLELWTINE